MRNFEVLGPFNLHNKRVSSIASCATAIHNLIILKFNIAEMKSNNSLLFFIANFIVQTETFIFKSSHAI